MNPPEQPSFTPTPQTPPQPAPAPVPQTQPIVEQAPSPFVQPVPAAPLQSQRTPGRKRRFALILAILFVVVVGGGAAAYYLGKGEQGATPASQTAANSAADDDSSDVDDHSATASDADAQDQTTLARANAMMLNKKAEAYNAEQGSYPQTLADFEASDNSSLKNIGFTVATSAPTSGTEPSYHYCSASGAQIFYFDAVQAKTIMIALGDASSDTSCK